MADEFVLDFTGVEAVKGAGSQGDRVPEGHYRAVVTKWIQQTSAAGNPMHIPWFEIEGGEQDGKKLMDRFVIVPNTPPDKNYGLRKMLGFLNCIGLNPDRKVKIDPRKVIINKRVMIYVEDEAIVINDVDTGRVRSVIRGYDAVEDTTPAAPATNGVAKVTKVVGKAAVAPVEEVEEVAEVASAEEIAPVEDETPVATAVAPAEDVEDAEEAASLFS